MVMAEERIYQDTGCYGSQIADEYNYKRVGFIEDHILSIRFKLKGFDARFVLR